MRRALIGACAVWFGAAAPLGQTSDSPSGFERLRKAAVRGQYKWVHQGGLGLILEQKTEEAIRAMTAFVAQHPDDAESEFILALAYAKRGDTTNAAWAMNYALALGLPPERFLAGPTELTDLLRENEVYAKVLGRKTMLRDDGLLHGPIVGDVTPTSARVWVRTTGPARVVVRVEPAIVGGGNGRAPERLERAGEGLSSVASDRTATVLVQGLTPGLEYGYRVEIEGAASPARGSFTTPPAAASKFSIVFGGGAGYVPQNERVWTEIARQRPTALLLLGDNVYSDAPESSAMQRYCYYRRQSRPEFRALTAGTPTYAIWDDHDFATDDSWGGPEISVPAWKPEVWAVFRQNWPNPDFGGGPDRPGCWYRFSIGDVEFFMLDGRYYRTDPGRPDPTMLGPEQRVWLLRGLAASTATFKCLVSPVPWDFRAKPGSLDTWNGYRDEREAIFATIEREKIEGVVLISADRHRSDGWKIDRPAGYALYEFSSSRLTNQHAHPTTDDAIFSYNAKQSFGLVEFDTTADDPRIAYTVISIDGERVHTLALTLADLSFKKE